MRQRDPATMRPGRCPSQTPACWVPSEPGYCRLTCRSAIARQLSALSCRRHPGCQTLVSRRRQRQSSWVAYRALASASCRRVRSELEKATSPVSPPALVLQVLHGAAAARRRLLQHRLVQRHGDAAGPVQLHAGRHGCAVYFFCVGFACSWGSGGCAGQEQPPPVTFVGPPCLSPACCLRMHRLLFARNTLQRACSASATPPVP